MNSLAIIIDADADPDRVVELLLALNDLYAELSDGDELVISSVAAPQ